MDAAVAALVGAALGMAGTVVTPMVTAYQAKRAKGQDLMRDAYARGFACLAKIPRCDTVEDHKKLRDKMLDALAHIEIVGTKVTGDLYGTVVDAYEEWKIKGGTNTDFATSAKKFEAAARADIDSTDVSGVSIPVVIARSAASVLALVIYWWARFPAVVRAPNRWWGALEFGAAVLLSMVALYFVVDAVVRLLRGRLWATARQGVSG